METYIRNNVKGYYIEFSEPLDPIVWDGKIGTTYQDFIDGKWVHLSSEQLAFRAEHPSASISEVIAMEITPTPPRTLEQAKQQKINQIEGYNTSDAVNSFNIVKDGETITDWFTPDIRANYRLSIESAETLGKETLLIPIQGIDEPVVLPVQTAKVMLSQIHLYADACYMVTEAHKAAVETLETIEAVDAYDYTTGYPEKPTFNL